MATTMTETIQNPFEPTLHRTQLNKWQLFVTPSRIAYVGLLGSPGTRILGATTLYLSLGNPFRMWQRGSEFREATFSIVPAYIPHRIETSDRNIAEVLIESESVESDTVISQLASTRSHAEQTAHRVLEGFRHAQKMHAMDGGLDLDALFFDSALRPRRLDPRIAAVIERINKSPEEKHSAESLADQSGLSFSRFTHLFCEQTGTALRSFRAWKRARGVMHFLKKSNNLLDAALNMGYADSTHFSHALRRFYGLSPRDMFAGARGVTVFDQKSTATLGAHSFCLR